MVKAVVGANWGDEGKGKITDMLAAQADIIVRFQGGANAGHTIVNDYGKFALHTLPSGVFYGHTTSVIGNGVALNIPILINEIKSITDRNVPMPKIVVSDRAQMVMPYHILFDQYEEERLGKKSFGSTKSGIAPFYSDKYAKIGFQVSELFDEALLKDKVVRICEQKNVILKHLYHKPALQPEELLATLHEYKEMIEPYVCDVSVFLDKALKEGKTILLEGQLGTLKDPDHGIYPMVTSSSTLAAYGAIGAGIPPYEIRQIVTVCKAYSSAVGAGAFVSEIFGDEADELRRRGGDGGEFGATTGRPRRMGWFDCVASKYGCRLQGATDVAFTVLDALGYLDEIPVCVGYDIDGEVTTDFPVTYKLEKAKPVLKKLPGWKCDIRGIKKYEDLPENCRRYVEFVEEQIGYPITMVSNGPGREDIIYRESPLQK
ncbi:adenylosuccinate synthase [Suilimivivens sp.]|uniref:adenylosuccinate synthase n=1 Tax=Suilimivivens sp. TaxID=2981669 RepID=UPI003078AD5C